ncbi:MAG: monomeric [FeFe] hydrogenase [Bacilli bacterium]|nr:monomeric [FeFe] hydrogenase [Bacilli bacterium]
MPKFDTRVQKLRHEILMQIAKRAYEGKSSEDILYEVPKEVVAGPKATFRCCIYKERAIVEERVRITLKAKSKSEGNVIKVISIACDECPLGGYQVTSDCRGCIAHRCAEACPKQCISFDENLHAHIDKTKCVNCGMCAQACPYSAINNRVRPCEKACKVKAIHPNPETNEAIIDNSKCIHCGSCVYMCPFGAVADESYILDIIAMLQDTSKKTYAVIAPAIAANTGEFTVGQCVHALKLLGFADVYEAALGADFVAIEEAKELAERGKLTSSCCPAFASYQRKTAPEFAQYISSSLSPMAMMGKILKESDPDCNVVFIGPCTAKKSEIKNEKVSPWIDSVMTFEEMQALIDSRDFDTSGELVEEEFTHPSSSFGRGFAKCGGLSVAVVESLKEQGIDFEVKSAAVDGIDNIKKTLLQFKKPDSPYNFVEGMACVGGCIGGPCNLNHNLRNKILIDKYSAQANKNIKEAAGEDVDE